MKYIQHVLFPEEIQTSINPGFYAAQWLLYCLWKSEFQLIST